VRARQDAYVEENLEVVGVVGGKIILQLVSSTGVGAVCGAFGLVPFGGKNFDRSATVKEGSELEGKKRTGSSWCRNGKRQQFKTSWY
jgi:hypothetical protein